MKKNQLSTIMVISSEHKTETLQVNMWLVRHAKSLLISMGILILALVTGLVYITNQHMRSTNNSITLEAKFKDLENYSSAEAATKINELKKSEKTILELQEYLDQRGATKAPPKSKNDPSQPMGGAYRPISSEAPFSEQYNQRITSLLNIIHTTPIGVPHDGVLTSRFGNRANPFSGSGGENHPGLDFKATQGEAIRATADGEVVYASPMGGYGNLVRISHASGYDTLFGHMSKIEVTVGQKVHAGDEIGKVGSTGRSTGPHLHYEVRRDNIPLDPEQFLTLNMPSR